MRSKSSKKLTPFWAFMLGVMTALVITAATFVLITNAPVPFVTKVEHIASNVDEALLDGKTIDPNRPLYVGGDSEEITAIDANQDEMAINAFWIQVGAFEDQKEAEAMRVTIAFLGLDAQIIYNNNAGQRIFRVRIGPYQTQEQAEEMIQVLKDNQISGQLIQTQSSSN